MCLCNNGRLTNSSLTILRNGCLLFSWFYIACQTRKGDLPEFFRHENQPPPPSLSKLVDRRTGKKADLLNCLERSPLGSGNADEEEVLVDETNNTGYEETVDPVSDDIAIEELSDFISGTELEPCTQEEEQLINKDTAAYIAADRPHEADVKILVQVSSPRKSNTFQDYSNSVFLPYIFGQVQSVRQLDIVWDVYLAYILKAGTRSK